MDMINPQVQKIEISGIRQFYNRIQHVENMISLTIGQPDFQTPQHIKQAAIQAINDNITSYTHNAGFIDLRRAVSHFMKVKYELNYNPDSEIIITNGASQAIDTALRTILSAEDEVILPSPVYPGYTPIIIQCGAKPIFIDTTKTSFKMKAHLIEEAISEKTKCIILPYPSNPTGVSLSQSELEEIATIAKKHNLLIVTDEIYSELTYEQAHVSLGTIAKERTIVINGLSKSHAMTGWRIGVLLAPEWLSKECLKVHQYNVSCASSISQMAALAAYSHGIDDAIPMTREYKSRKELTSRYLRELGFSVIEPDGAFYFLVGIPSTLSSFDFAIQLAERAKVGVIPGTAFDPHGEGYVRISYACSEEMIHEAFKRIKHFLENNGQ